MLITCAICNNDINTADLVLSERPLGKLIKVFYTCPYCGAEYHVMWHNDETKELQKKLDQARANNDTVAFNRLQSVFKKKLDKLRFVCLMIINLITDNQRRTRFLY